MLETVCHNGWIELIELVALIEPWVAERLLGEFLWILGGFTTQMEMVLTSDRFEALFPATYIVLDQSPVCPYGLRGFWCYLSRL